MLAKKIGAILRGKATPAQIMLACVLGAALGFMPGFAQAPGLIVILTLLLIILNANLGLVVLVAGAAKILSLVLLPVSFQIGRVLLDGPTQELFKSAINAPVLALCGFEYYATSGGLLLGGVLGVVIGVVVISVIRKVRAKMAALEAGSDLYKKLAGSWWVRLISSLFIGKAAKQSYSDLLEQKGKVIRPVGVVFSVAIVALLFVGQMFFAGDILTAALRGGLERANGATVDLESADVDLAEGKMTLSGLAVADPNRLDTDLFRAARIEIDISATDMLRKRLKLDRIVISEAQNGVKRDVPGRLVGDRSPIEKREGKGFELRPGEKTLDDYLKNAKLWKERLAQVKGWMDVVSSRSGASEESVESPASETLKERLMREALEKGYARVAASHLIDGAPTLTVTELVAEGVRCESLDGKAVDIKAGNLSTQPHLLNESPRIALVAQDGSFKADVTLAAAGGGESTIDLLYRGLSGDVVGEQLSVAGTKPISGGTVDIALQGTFRNTGGTYIDLPMQVTLHNTTVSVAGGGSAPIKEMTLPIGLRGPIDNPRIYIDDKKLADALVKAGAGALASRAKQETDKLLDEQTEKLGEKLGDKAGGQVKETLKGLGGLLGGKKKDDGGK